MPGKVYAAVLPEDLSGFGQEHQLKLEVIKEDMLKNHGYYRVLHEGIQTGIISADSGVYQFTPPENVLGKWEIKQLIKEGASDAVLLDLDGDGEKELAVISPFHGDKISIWKQVDGEFKEIYVWEEKAQFCHAIYGGPLCGKETVVIGHRKGERALLAFTYNQERKTYEVRILDEDCGPANIYHYIKNGKDRLLSANREIDQVALYTLEQ